MKLFVGVHNAYTQSPTTADMAPFRIVTAGGKFIVHAELKTLPLVVFFETKPDLLRFLYETQQKQVLSLALSVV